MSLGREELSAAHRRERCCLALGASLLGGAEGAGRWRCLLLLGMLLWQVRNAWHSFPHACSVSANTLTVLLWLELFCVAFFFFPSYPAILSNNLNFLLSQWESEGSGMAGFAQHRGKGWEAERWAYGRASSSPTPLQNEE